MKVERNVFILRIFYETLFSESAWFGEMQSLSGLYPASVLCNGTIVSRTSKDCTQSQDIYYIFTFYKLGVWPYSYITSIAFNSQPKVGFIVLVLF